MWWLTSLFWYVNQSSMTSCRMINLLLVHNVSAIHWGHQNPGVLYYLLLARVVEANHFDSLYLQAISSTLMCSPDATNVSTVALVHVLSPLIFTQWTDSIFGILGPPLTLCLSNVIVTI